MSPRRQPISLKLSESRIPRTRVEGRRVAIFDDLYHWVLVRPWWQYFVLVAGTFLGLNAIFGLLYTLDPHCIQNARPGNFEDAFFFSVQTIGTIGYGNMSPATRYGHVLVTIEALVGILGIAVMTGATFAKFARPTSRVLFADKAIVAPRDGVPHLMFRIANWRHNQVVEARLRIVMLIDEQTREGQTMRRQLELPLVRDRTALFTLTWTAMHRIDEASPFFGPDAMKMLRDRRAELLLSLSGTDETMGQSIHARHRYGLEDIAWDSLFVDVLHIGSDGVRHLDYSTFHDVVLITDASASDGAGHPSKSP